MAFIRIIEKVDASPELEVLYARVGNPDGSVDNVMKMHGLNPESLRTHFEMYIAAMHKPSPLSRAEREMVAVSVSRLNGCNYCLTHHTRGLERLLAGERKGVALALAGGDASSLTPRERALIDYARKLTQRPAEMDDEDVERLREAGHDDRAILDLAQCIGYFNYVNRMVTGLGVRLGDSEGEAGQWPQ